ANSTITMNPVATSDAAFRGGACPTPEYTIAYTGNYTTSADANKLSTLHFAQTCWTASFKTARASSNRSSSIFWWRWATGALIEMRPSNLANRATGALTA
ncbi:hypothetical protein, partial [Parapedomonas caeni]